MLNTAAECADRARIEREAAAYSLIGASSAVGVGLAAVGRERADRVRFVGEELAVFVLHAAGLALVDVGHDDHRNDRTQAQAGAQADVFAGALDRT
jgi:hypothetical protein